MRTERAQGRGCPGTANNLLRVPFPRYITEVYPGYFLGYPLTGSFERDCAGEVYDRLCDEMDLYHLLFDAARDMSICGVGYVLVWLDWMGRSPLLLYPAKHPRLWRTAGLRALRTPGVGGDRWSGV